MSANDETKIPALIGKRVILVNLNTTRLNGYIGLVLGWDANRGRFKIKLFFNNAIKLLKPANVRFFIDKHSLSEPAKVIWNLSINMKKEKNVCMKPFKHYVTILDEMETSYQGMYVKVHFLHLLAPFRATYLNTRNVKIFSSYLRKVLKNCSDYPDLAIVVKLTIGFIAVTHGKEARILCDTLENHYGYLPKIFSLLRTNIQEENLEDLSLDFFQIYLNAKTMIENRTYDATLTIIEFFPKAYSFFMHNQSSLPNAERELNFIIGNVEKKEYFSLYFAFHSYRTGNYREALEHATNHQIHYSENQGGEVQSLTGTYEVKLKCYIQLGNKKSAISCLKRYKKYVKHYCPGRVIDIKSFSEKIQAMSENEDEGDLTYTCPPARIMERCSYYGCKKMEKTIREFKVCSICQIPRYCSKKCQKLDWKSHKERCLPKNETN